jgi:two-component system repressor protein LuxO
MNSSTKAEAHDRRRALVVDDDPRLCRLLEYNLGKWGYAVDSVGDGLAMRKALIRCAYDVVLLDVRLPDGDGVSLLSGIRDSFPDTKVIMVSAHGNVSVAMEAVRAGAFDFLTKPLDLDRCHISVRNAFQMAERVREYEMLRQVVSDRDSLGSIIGSSGPMQAVYEIIGNVGPSDCSVLITGETGTGKELVAKELHRLSSRAEHEIVTVNCAAIPGELLESEMFGHMKGSFTGALHDKAGCAERANGSTLFLDEIGELHSGLQAKLLRFLEDRHVTRVGGAGRIKVDTRIITATNRDPDKAVSLGQLRSDLLYRINVVRIHLPPLRERRPDIPLLAERFLEQAAHASGKPFRSINAKAMGILADADWPGNVRQLKNVITETVLINRGHCITEDMLPQAVRSSASNGDRYKAAAPQIGDHIRVRPFWETEKAALQHAVLACNGNVTHAAKILEISRPTLYRRIKHYGIECGKRVSAPPPGTACGADDDSPAP